MSQSVEAGIVTNTIKKITNFASWIGKLTSPVKSFDVNGGDAKMDESSGIVSAELDLQSIAKIKDAEGNPIYLTILLSATNIKDIVNDFINPILEYDNAIQSGDADRIDSTTEDAKAGIDILYGDDGLLSQELSDGTTPEQLPKSWQELAQRLAYSLTCKSPNKDDGSISGQSISNVVKLVAEYMEKVGITQFVSEIKIDPNVLILPILKPIYQWLYEYMVPVMNRIVNYENSKDSIDDIVESEVIEEMNASKQIKVVLQKISGSTNVEMLGIKANYEPGLALTDLDELLNDEQFTTIIMENPQTYTIAPTETDFDISVDPEILPRMSEDSLATLFKQAICLYRNLYMLHWLSIGDDMMKLHNLTEDLYSVLIGQVDTIGELLVELTGTIPNVYDIPAPAFETRNYTFEDGICTLIDMVQNYIDYMDITYPNQTKDVQAMMDEWLRYWTKQLNYFLKRQV